MPASELLQLVRDEDFEGFELMCLEALESQRVRLADLVAPFEELERGSHVDRAAALGAMVLENSDVSGDPPAALKIARVALLGDPKNEDLRRRVVDLYTQVHGQKPGFAALLEMSGLASGRPARNALRLIDICLSVKPGAPLISRVEEVVVEVAEVDLEHGLITLKHPQRSKAITPLELSREYEQVAPDDFRVLRAFKPESVTELLKTDPVAVVVGVIHAHGEMISQDELKQELVPKYLEAKAWSKWWTGAKTKLQRCPHVIMEGRTPVMLRYTADAWTIEDATWEAIGSQAGPDEWLGTLEGYLREKKKHKEEPDVGLLVRLRKHLDQRREAIAKPRPAEALACALVSQRIDEIAPDVGEDAKELTERLLRESQNPMKLIKRLENETLWNWALKALTKARPDDAAFYAAELFPVAGAALLDRLAAMAQKAEVIELVQSHVDTALADPVDHPEIVYWLWKGPKKVEGLRLPADDDLFALMIQTLSALGRSLNPGEEVMKTFRNRIRTVLGLRDFGRASECVARVRADRAITLRTQLERLEGMGDNARYKLLNRLREAHPEVFAVKSRKLEPWENPDVLWNTVGGIRRKTSERDELVNVKMHENAKRIGEAASHGDLSENSEYKFALEERDFLRARLAQMNSELSLSETLEAHQVPTEFIGVGSRVVLREVADNTTREMTFLGPFDTDIDNGIYNYKAPVCLELMGLHVGDHKLLMMGDQKTEVEVVEITNGLA